MAEFKQSEEPPETIKDPDKLISPGGKTFKHGEEKYYTPGQVKKQTPAGSTLRYLATKTEKGRVKLTPYYKNQITWEKHRWQKYGADKLTAIKKLPEEDLGQRAEELAKEEFKKTQREVTQKQKKGTFREDWDEIQPSKKEIIKEIPKEKKERIELLNLAAKMKKEDEFNVSEIYQGIDTFPEKIALTHYLKQKVPEKQKEALKRMGKWQKVQDIKQEARSEWSKRRRHHPDPRYTFQFSTREEGGVIRRYYDGELQSKKLVQPGGDTAVFYSDPSVYDFTTVIKEPGRTTYKAEDTNFKYIDQTVNRGEVPGGKTTYTKEDGEFTLSKVAGQKPQTYVEQQIQDKDVEIDVEKGQESFKVAGLSLTLAKDTEPGTYTAETTKQGIQLQPTQEMIERKAKQAQGTTIDVEGEQDTFKASGMTWKLGKDTKPGEYTLKYTEQGIQLQPTRETLASWENIEELEPGEEFTIQKNKKYLLPRKPKPYTFKEGVGEEKELKIKEGEPIFLPADRKKISSDLPIYIEPGENQVMSLKGKTFKFKDIEEEEAGWYNLEITEEGEVKATRTEMPEYADVGKIQLTGFGFQVKETDQMPKGAKGTIKENIGQAYQLTDEGWERSQLYGASTIRREDIELTQEMQERIKIRGEKGDLAIAKAGGEVEIPVSKRELEGMEKYGKWEYTVAPSPYQVYHSAVKVSKRAEELKSEDITEAIKTPGKQIKGEALDVLAGAGTTGALMAATPERVVQKGGALIGEDIGGKTIGSIQVLDEDYPGTKTTKESAVAGEVLGAIYTGKAVSGAAGIAWKPVSPYVTSYIGETGKGLAKISNLATRKVRGIGLPTPSYGSVTAWGKRIGTAAIAGGLTGYEAGKLQKMKREGATWEQVGAQAAIDVGYIYGSIKGFPKGMETYENLKIRYKLSTMDTANLPKQGLFNQRGVVPRSKSPWPTDKTGEPYLTGGHKRFVTYNQRYSTATGYKQRFKQVASKRTLRDYFGKVSPQKYRVWHQYSPGTKPTIAEMVTGKTTGTGTRARGIYTKPEVKLALKQASKQGFTKKTLSPQQIDDIVAQAKTLGQRGGKELVQLSKSQADDILTQGAYYQKITKGGQYEVPGKWYYPEPGMIRSGAEPTDPLTALKGKYGEIAKETAGQTKIQKASKTVLRTIDDIKFSSGGRGKYHVSDLQIGDDVLGGRSLQKASGKPLWSKRSFNWMTQRTGQQKAHFIPQEFGPTGEMQVVQPPGDLYREGTTVAVKWKGGKLYQATHIKPIQTTDELTQAIATGEKIKTSTELAKEATATTISSYGSRYPATISPIISPTTSPYTSPTTSPITSPEPSPTPSPYPSPTTSPQPSPTPSPYLGLRTSHTTPPWAHPPPFCATIYTLEAVARHVQQYAPIHHQAQVQAHTHHQAQHQHQPQAHSQY